MKWVDTSNQGGKWTAVTGNIKGMQTLQLTSAGRYTYGAFTMGQTCIPVALHYFPKKPWTNMAMLQMRKPRGWENLERISCRWSWGEVSRIFFWFSSSTKRMLHSRLVYSHSALHSVLDLPQCLRARKETKSRHGEVVWPLIAKR